MPERRNERKTWEEAKMKALWTFDNQLKIDQFIALLDSNGIGHEVSTIKAPAGKLAMTLSVNEKEYEKAKKLLVRHRKRRTTGDYK